MCAILCLWQGAANPHPLKSSSIEQHPKQSLSVAELPPTSVINAADLRKRDGEPIGESIPKWRDPQWITLSITALYTLFSGITLVAIFRQNRSIQNTERAVLVPSWNDLVHQNPEVESGTLSHCFQWNFQNCGKTPGFIRELQGTLILLNSLDDLPLKPKFDKLVQFQSDPLIPGKMMETMIFSPLGDSRDYQTVDAEFRKNGKILFAYGIVRYEDIFGKMHETRFGVRYEARDNFSPSNDHFVVAGPKSYNQYT